MAFGSGRSAGGGFASGARWSSERCGRLLVVVRDYGRTGLPELATAEDQQPVEALGADGADEPLRDRVGECRRLRSIPLLSSELFG